MIHFSWNFYAFEQVRKVGRVARAIAIMSHPIPNTNDSHSVQVILPQKQLGRRSDMWVPHATINLINISSTHPKIIRSLRIKPVQLPKFPFPVWVVYEHNIDLILN